MKQDKQELIKILTNIGFSIPSEKSIDKDIQKYLVIENYDMGKPIILPDEIPKNVFNLELPSKYELSSID